MKKLKCKDSTQFFQYDSRLQQKKSGGADQKSQIA